MSQHTVREKTADVCTRPATYQRELSATTPSVRHGYTHQHRTHTTHCTCWFKSGKSTIAGPMQLLRLRQKDPQNVMRLRPNPPCLPTSDLCRRISFSCPCRTGAIVSLSLSQKSQSFLALPLAPVATPQSSPSVLVNTAGRRLVGRFIRRQPVLGRYRASRNTIYGW